MGMNMEGSDIGIPKIIVTHLSEGGDARSISSNLIENR
jgi:hypothetical protein